MLADTFTLPASKIVVSNRIAKASMSEAMADLRGRPTEALERLYRAWSAGGALYVTGGKYSYETGGETRFVYSNDVWRMTRGA